MNEKHLKANYGLGKAFLSQNNNEGIVYLERVINISEKYLEEQFIKYYINACKHIYNYYIRQRYNEKAQEYYNKIINHSEIVEYAKNEREVLTFKDELILHDLDEDHVNRIINVLNKHPEISEAYLTKKKVIYFENSPVYVLGIMVKGMYNYEKVIKKLIDTGLNVNFDFL
ncbi:hypothetical protein ABG79_01918 [Caloramator mitchellensis]|uniref:Uncharacterized protein n=1 Tax=Caloramator mitchellensis TaxID=908809 RepID=A0A0R3JS13_CALMK|nr:hypothetical protein [Caloramator mitchellensis]KRQ86295.1 hypothetical protein ABG79_01918 [Caloramator mitchellensis]